MPPSTWSDNSPEYPERGTDAPPPETWRGLAVAWPIIAILVACAILALVVIR